MTVTAEEDAQGGPSVYEVEVTRERVSQAAQAAWAGIDAGTFRSQWPVVGSTLLALMLATRRDVRARVLADLTRRLSETIGVQVSPVFVPPQAVALAPNGLDPADFLRRTPFVVDARIGAGMGPEEAVTMAARWTTGLLDAEPFRVQRAVVEEAVATDARYRGWVRVAEPGACAFCRMLSSRGAVYRTDGSALVTRNGQRYHARCRCYAQEVVDRQVADAIKREGEDAWRQQVAAGDRPRIRSRSGSTVTGPDGIPADLVGLPVERQLELIQARITFYESMAGEKSSIPGRRNYATSNAEALRRLLARLTT